MNLLAHQLNFWFLYPEIYQDFFAKFAYVSQAPYSVRRQAWWIGKKSNYVTAIQKIWRNWYIWINSNNSIDWIDRWSIKLYEWVDEWFKEYSISQIYPGIGEITSKIQIILDKHWITWIQIWILAEIWRGHWAWFTGNLCAQIAEYVWKVYDVEDTHKLAIRLEEIFRWDQAYWDRSYVSVLEQEMCLYAESQTNDKEIGYWSVSLTQKLSIDITLFYSWQSAEVELTDQKISSDILRIETIWETLKKYLWDMSNDLHTHPNITVFQEKWGYDTLENTLLLINGMIVDVIIKIQNDSDDIYIERLLDYVEDIHDIVSIINWNDRFIEDYMKNFYISQTSPFEKCAIIPLYSGKFWWWYLCFTKFGKSRKTLEKVIQEMSGLYPGVEVEYASFRDKDISTFEVLQDTTNWIYSTYVKEWQLLYVDSLWEKRIWDYDQLFELAKDGILLDQIHNKVFVLWDKTNKQQIKSQTSTVEVLAPLITSPWVSVSNMTYDPSTFTRQQNQMLWKIIWPLRKIYQEIYDEELPITCTGSLREFELKLQPSKHKIALISKI